MSRLFLESNSNDCDLDGIEVEIFCEFINKYKFDLGSLFDIMTYRNNTIFFGDLESDTYYISNKLRQMFGFESNIVKNFLNEWRTRIVNKADLKLYDKSMELIFIKSNKIQDLIYKVADVNGEEHWVSCQGKMKTENKKPRFFVGRITILDNDIDIDSVTKLQRKNGAMGKILNYELNKIGIIGFSLNHLRIINDSKGRDCADKFLKKTVDKIDRAFSDKIHLYRIEGLKFLVVVNEDYLDAIEEIAIKIKSIVDHEYSSNNFIFKKNTGIGIYIADKGKMMSENILDVFDKIMAVAKENIAGNDISVLSDKDIFGRHYMNKIELELHRCVYSNFENFRIVAQPIVDNDDKVVSAEVLLRWKYEGQPISPEIFVPILERTGLIQQVGRFVFEETAKISKRIKKFRSDFKLHVNVSYLQILDKEFLPFIKATLKKYHLTGKEILVELTENNYDEDKERVLDFADKCRVMGIMSAIDDFGVGFSSLSFLIRYHADVVKIDKSLVKESIESEQNKKFLEGIITSCKNFGMLICVEGIENEQELKTVRELGCDYIQGFYFFKPMEIYDFNDLIMRTHGETLLS